MGITAVFRFYDCQRRAAVTWNYDEANGGWYFNGSSSRPYGTMYQNEQTPDGYPVDGNGRWNHQ